MKTASELFDDLREEMERHTARLEAQAEDADAPAERLALRARARVAREFQGALAACFDGWNEATR